MTDYLKRTWAQIDLDAATHNFKQILRTADGTPVIAVVKADAYGHGAVRMSKLYAQLGAAALAVSNIEEGIELRRHELRLPILILGYTPPEEAARLAAYDIEQAVFSCEFAKALSDAAVGAGVHVKIHLKLDTGMGRIGFDCRQSDRLQEAAQLAAQAARLPGLISRGAFTHFSTADRDSDPNGEFTAAQYERFATATALIRAKGVALPVCHCCNSAGLMLHADKHMDAMRAGIILYGLTPNAGLAFIDDFKPVMELKSTVSMVKTLKAGDYVSYGRTFQAPHDCVVATVAVGYADGYPRVASGKGRVLIHGQFAPILGRVCMDQMMIDVTDIENVQMGDTVTLFGRDGDRQLPAEELAKLAGTINYETVCDVGPRVPRVYIQGGKIEHVLNRLV